MNSFVYAIAFVEGIGLEMHKYPSIHGYTRSCWLRTKSSVEFCVHCIQWPMPIELDACVPRGSGSIGGKLFMSS